MSARAQARLAEIRAREAAATPGEWWFEQPWSGFSCVKCRKGVVFGTAAAENPNAEADHVFTVKSRADIPALLALADAAISGDPARIAEAVRAFGEGA